MVVIYMKQRRFLRLSPSNQIQFTMCLSNAFLQCTMVLFVYVFVISPDVHGILIYITHFTVSLFIAFSSWLTAWLCALYCVTLVSFRHKLITSLKMKLPAVVPKLLLVTFLGCLSITGAFVWCIKLTNHQVMTDNLSYNSTKNTKVIMKKCCSTWFYTLSSILPMISSITSLFFTVTSLLGHIWKIKHQKSSLSDPQLDAHYKACKTMVMFVIVFVILVVAKTLANSSLSLREDVTINLFSCLYQCYPTEMSLILIFGSSKLKRALRRAISCTRQ
ncbi:taste receptor type 2 member 40-like [Bombina bombina]|uniref:taste receptor type 2 member 40-like n=1 Tax=Bombina bombina TaxID=8345 RepID=UPI00235B3010|nr:taste receptor type 2 member 40-like [Bombina bombina]